MATEYARGSQAWYLSHIGGEETSPTHSTRKLMTSATLNQATETYNGWANYETWNVALWLQNDYVLYQFARRYDDYSKFVAAIGFGSETPDGVSFASPKLDYNELNEMMSEL